MTSRSEQVRDSLARLNAAAARAGRALRFMEVCGTHTMSAFRCGLHSLMPQNVTLLSGPGCPVCVTAQGEIDALIELAVEHDVAVCTYGDMLRVPGARGSLEEARANGAEVKVVYSALDALKLAEARPGREVVFAAVGFETTAPATAALILRAKARGVENLSVLASHKQVVPAMLALLASGQAKVDGFLCPGHVSVVIGAQAYLPIVEGYKLPCVIAGFEDVQMAQALAALTEQAAAGEAELVNLYPQAVSDHGNQAARAVMERVFEPADARWRGLGEIAGSGLALRAAYLGFDAAARFGLSMPADCEPRGCRCGEVITGRVTPVQCVLFGRSCTPTQPVGPCMVSSEGTCQAWFKYRRGKHGQAEPAHGTRVAHLAEVAS